MKKFGLIVFTLFFALSALAVAPAMAEHDGKQCPMGEKCEGRNCQKCGDKDADCGCPVAEKILKKAKFFLKNAKEIGLSDEQVAQIKAIKMDTKKTAIRTKAEMEIFHMDLEAKLSEPTVDVEGLNAMADQASGGFNTGFKASIATYAKLKAILSETQMAKAKDIWMSKKSD